MAHKLVPLTLEQHQQVLYEILYMVDDFCKAHDIPYFLIGGSLLGAVRHQGIIPWDDDIDIAMTRENYERFLSIFHAEGVDGYELYDYEHVDGYYLPFAKMAKRDSWTSTWETHKIHIDIFSYEGCGDNLQEAQEYFAKNKRTIKRFCNMITLGVFFWKNVFSWKEYLYYFVMNFLHDIVFCFPVWICPSCRRRYMRQAYSAVTRYSVMDTKYCANISWGRYGKGEVQPSSSFLILDTKRFGTRDLPVPSGWRAYLTGIYGDYMKEPPENKRLCHIKDGSYLVVQTSE